MNFEYKAYAYFLALCSCSLNMTMMTSSSIHKTGWEPLSIHLVFCSIYSASTRSYCEKSVKGSSSLALAKG